MDVSGYRELGVELLRIQGWGSGRSGRALCAHFSPLRQDHLSLPSQACGTTKPALTGSRILCLVPHRKFTEASFCGWPGLAEILGIEWTGSNGASWNGGLWRAEGL